MHRMVRSSLDCLVFGMSNDGIYCCPQIPQLKLVEDVQNINDQLEKSHTPPQYTTAKNVRFRYRMLSKRKRINRLVSSSN